jgi:hypothetical protein
MAGRVDKESGQGFGVARSEDSVEYRPGMGFFISLLALCAFFFVVAAFFFWYIPTVGLGSIHPYLPHAVGAVALSAALFVVFGALTVAYTVATGRAAFFPSRLRWLLFRFFLPLMAMICGMAGVSKTRLERAFIDINNRMVLAMRKRLNPERLLLLMPHCIQFEDCRIKVTKDVRNCVSCGKCEIADLLSISRDYNVNLFVSTGGTVARRKVVETRPDAVVAVACERDLVSGLRDAYPLPVYAIINKRPMGYCAQTGVAVADVRDAVLKFLS